MLGAVLNSINNSNNKRKMKQQTSSDSQTQLSETEVSNTDFTLNLPTGQCRRLRHRKQNSISSFFGVGKRDQFQVSDSLHPKGPGSLIAANYSLKDPS